MLTGIQGVKPPDVGRGKMMNEASEQRLADIKRRIERGEYRVDPKAVADAILQRARARAAASSARAPDQERQNECSYPDRDPEASLKVTPWGPSLTRPTHVSRRLLFALRMLSGIQTHSS
jgi:hypothetical protein